MIPEIPERIKRAFTSGGVLQTPEQELWRERAARMTLDALGFTNLTVKKREHNEVVTYARRWFRGFYDDPADDTPVDNVEATFDYAGVALVPVRESVLEIKPKLFELPDDID